jgi:hypothetical protein
MIQSCLEHAKQNGSGWWVVLAGLIQVFRSIFFQKVERIATEPKTKEGAVAALTEEERMKILGANYRPPDPNAPEVKTMMSSLIALWRFFKKKPALGLGD